MGMLPSKFGIHVRLTTTDLLIDSLTRDARTKVGGQGNSVVQKKFEHKGDTRIGRTNDGDLARATIVTRLGFDHTGIVTLEREGLMMSEEENNAEDTVS